MRVRLTLVLVLGAVLALALPAAAQFPTPQRQDIIWARNAPGATITLDGVLSEPEWAQAESVVVRYGVDNGIPGSGYFEEGGKLAKDSTYAVIRFLMVGNQLYMAATVRDSSVGGSKDFNRFDGFLMSFKNHTVGAGNPAPPTEYFYSWWYPQIDSCGISSLTPGLPPDFRGVYGNRPKCTDRTADMIAAWDGATVVNGLSNADSIVDHGYTTELRFDMGRLGYDFTKPGGEIIEWNIQIYDNDWYWPQNLFRWSMNRAWWQSPWGSDMWYDQVQIHTRADVAVGSGAVPAVQPDMVMFNGANKPLPVIDGFLNDPVWASAQSFDIRYGDQALRDSYPGVLKYRAGQYQPSVNGGQAFVFDPGDATVKWFFREDTLYLGFDVRDQDVQYYPLIDRQDGFIVTIQDRTLRWRDRNLYSHRITFFVDSTGHGGRADFLPGLMDTLHGAKFALQLKPGTTLDTLGADFDTGYTAEMAIDLTKLGYPHGLGDHILWIGFDLMDGDSYTPSTLSYGTRTWWGRQYENECCPAMVYMDPTQMLVGVPPAAPPAAEFALRGNYPNPARGTTMIRFALDAPSEMSLEVFDVQGRQVASRSLGLQSAGDRTVSFTRPGSGAGLFFYRLRAHDPVSGRTRVTGSGKMMFLK